MQTLPPHYHFSPSSSAVQYRKSSFPSSSSSSSSFLSSIIISTQQSREPSKRNYFQRKWTAKPTKCKLMKRWMDCFSFSLYTSKKGLFDHHSTLNMIIFNRPRHEEDQEKVFAKRSRKLSPSKLLGRCP